MATDKPDPRRSLYIFCSGRKGWGKSYVCRAWFDPYPFDRVVIDPTHDVARDLRRDGVPFTVLEPDFLPATLPRDPEGKQQTWVFSPDMGSASALDDMDRVAGLCIGRGPVLLWVDEVGATGTAHKTPPNMRRILHHGRHDDISLLGAAPRPRDIDTLWMAQANKVYTGRTPNNYDREAIANAIGYPPGEFSAINSRLTGHEHTMYDADEDELWIMRPLPPRRPGRHYPDETGGQLVELSER